MNRAIKGAGLLIAGAIMLAGLMIGRAPTPPVAAFILIVSIINMIWGYLCLLWPSITFIINAIWRCLCYLWPENEK